MQLTVPVLVHPQLPAPAALLRVTSRGRPHASSAPRRQPCGNADYGRSVMITPVSLEVGVAGLRVASSKGSEPPVFARATGQAGA
jgi:hypothetical protein